MHNRERTRVPWHGNVRIRGRDGARVGGDVVRVALSVREYAGAMTGTMTGAIAHHGTSAP